MTKSAFSLVQITDTHLYGDPAGRLRGVPTLPALRATLAAAAQDIAACEAVLATGDLVQDDPGGYSHFRHEFAALDKPILCVPGNHDDVPAMRAALTGKPFQLDGVFDHGNWRVLLLDSAIAGETGGALSDATLLQLEHGLAQAPDRHVLVCLHHHPVAMRSRWLDTIGLANADAFFAALKRHSNVRAVLFGHVHQSLDVMVDGLRVMATPSTCSQFRPLSQDFAVDDAPPAYRTLTLHPDGHIDSEVIWVEAEVHARVSRPASNRA
ncbi:MAG: 3',5'-cyclic-AMP phosphodiesterase [Pseudomonadota bacterium]